MGKAVVARACLATGDASLYYSNGGGVVGGIGIPKVRAEAIRMVSAYGDAVGLLTPMSEVDFPTVGHASFIALTAHGLSTSNASINEILSGGTRFANLIEAGQRVITAFRKSNVS